MDKDIHHYKRQLERELLNVKKCRKLSARNKELISDFYQYNSAQGLSAPRMLKQSQVLKHIGSVLKKDFDKATRKDYIEFMAYMNRKGYAKSSIATYVRIIKVFHKWLNDGTYPKCVEWMRAREPSHDYKLPEELLIQRDVKQLLKFCENRRDKALISLLWESGARVGEVGSLQIKHVSFDEFGCKVTLNGKTGMRRVRVVNSAPHLAEWINHHPQRDDPNAPLWVNVQAHYGNQMDYGSINMQLRRIAKKARVKKPVNPHNFRHSRATFMAQHLTEAQMKEYFGWVRESDMAARYVHLSGKQVDDAILKMHGLKPEEHEEDELKAEPCPRCRHPNDVTFEYCEKCWLPLKPSVQQEIEKIKGEQEEGSIVLLKLLDLAKTLSQSNPDKVRETLTALEQQMKVEVR